MTFLRLGVEQADGLDVPVEPLLAQLHHLLRRVCRAANSVPRRLVDADIGRLGRQHHRDEQGEGIGYIRARPGDWD